MIMHFTLLMATPSQGDSCLQSEYGDIYRVSLKFTDTLVTEVVIKYFDTIPPCVSICVLRTGFLFAASEFGNHTFYQFQVTNFFHPPRLLR